MSTSAAADAAKLDYESNSIRYSKELKFIDQLAADGVRHGTHYGDAQAYAEAIAGAFSAAGESTVRGYFVDFSENTLAERRNLGIFQTRGRPAQPEPQRHRQGLQRRQRGV